MSIFRSKPRPARQWAGDRMPSPRTPLAVVRNLTGDPVNPVKKDRPVRSEAYRRLVASLPCWLCEAEGISQAAHADERKGLSIKSSDLTCYPLCGPRTGLIGCHAVVGSSGRYTREERRMIEWRAQMDTQNTLKLLAYGDRTIADTLRKVGLL